MSLPGLPPLPKSLSAAGSSSNVPANNSHILSESSSSSKEIARGLSGHKVNNSLSSTPESTSASDFYKTSAATSTSTLDTQLSVLRREMFGLRQLDLSLLSQLWALNESIQGFRTYLQEQDTLSPPSPSPSPSDTNSISSDCEDELSPPPQPPPLTVSNNHTITMGATKAHPQLPPILQQRMRRAPPPPPPSRKPPHRPI